VHEWTVVERFWLRLLLLNSILGLAFSLFGLFVLTVSDAAPPTWRWCSVLALLCLLPYATMIIKNLVAFGGERLRSSGGSVVASYTLLGMLVAVCVLQLWNVTSATAFWPFYGAILALILGAIYQFIRLVLRPQSNEEKI
jgi:hypothetical protein